MLFKVKMDWNGMIYEVYDVQVSHKWIVTTSEMETHIAFLIYKGDWQYVAAEEFSPVTDFDYDE